MSNEGRADHPYVAHYEWPESQEDRSSLETRVREQQHIADAGQRMLLRRFRLGRYVLAMVCGVIAIMFVASTVAGIVVVIDSAGETEVNLLRMTEGGEPVRQQPVAYSTFLSMTLLMVALLVAAAVAAVFLARDGLHGRLWAVVAVVGVVGTLGAVVALTGKSDAVDGWLLTAAVCYVILTAASAWELWRVRWVRRRADLSTAS